MIVVAPHFPPLLVKKECYRLVVYFRQLVILSMDRSDSQLGLVDSPPPAVAYPMGRPPDLESSTGGDLAVEQLLVLRDAIQRIKERAPLPIPAFGELK
jgi:hypothetical protein